jgi:hypothetical protein
LIGVKTENGVEYITRFEHFRGLMPDETYEGIIEWINKEGLKYEDIIENLKRDLSSAQENTDVSELRCNELEDDANKTREVVQSWCNEIRNLIIDESLDVDVKNETIELINKIYNCID